WGCACSLLVRVRRITLGCLSILRWWVRFGCDRCSRVCISVSPGGARLSELLARHICDRNQSSGRTCIERCLHVCKVQNLEVFFLPSTGIAVHRVFVTLTQETQMVRAF